MIAASGPASPSDRNAAKVRASTAAKAPPTSAARCVVARVTAASGRTASSVARDLIVGVRTDVSPAPTVRVVLGWRGSVVVASPGVSGSRRRGPNAASMTTVALEASTDEGHQARIASSEQRRTGADRLVARKGSIDACRRATVPGSVIADREVNKLRSVGAAPRAATLVLDAATG